MAFDRSGNLLFVEPFGHKILKFAPDGSTSTFATGVEGPLPFDASGNLFAVDGTTGSIFKLSPDGIKSTFASRVGVPFSLACDAAGNLFVFDYNTGSIFKFTPTAKKSTFVEGKKHTIIVLACDRSGNLFAADADGDSIFKFTPDGLRSTFATQIKVNDLAINAAGNLFTVSYGSPTIFKFTPDGARSKLETKLSRPQSLACDAAGNLFVYDSEDPGKIVKLSPDGTISTFAQKQERGPVRSVSPDGKWELRSDDHGRFVVARVGSREVSVELSEVLGTFANYSNIVWSPDTKRFAFNYRPGTRYETTDLYQFDGAKWQELDDPESDATTVPLDRSMAAQKKKLKLSPERPGRPLMTSYHIRKWIDSNTALLYAHSAESFQIRNETQSVGASFFFTLKLDPAGKWKIARTREVPAKGVGGLNKIEQEEAKRIEEAPEETEADKMEWKQSQ
jgi:hypothetical protein